MIRKSLMLSAFASVAVSQGCGQMPHGLPTDSRDGTRESDGVAGGPKVPGAGGAASGWQSIGGVGGWYGCEGLHCSDGRIVLSNNCSTAYTQCEPVLNDGVECVPSGPCPKDARDAVPCDGADSSTDPNHCGACGEVCAPSLLARDPELYHGLLAADATNVYWASKTTSWVKRVPRDGGAPALIFQGDSDTRPTAMTASLGNVYLAVMDRTFTRGSVLRVKADGSASELVVSGPSAPILELVVDANNVYWFDNEGTVAKASLSDGLPEVIAVEQYANELAIGANDFYWATYGLMEGQKATLKKVALDGGEESLIVELSDRYIEHLAVDADYLYWVAEDGAISRMPRAGGEVTVLARPANRPYELAFDSSHAYWTEPSQTLYGTVNKVPLAGGPVTSLARLQHLPTEIALTSSRVVWVQSFFEDRITIIDKDPCRSGLCVE